MPARASRTAFVGRQRELAALTDRLALAQRGEGGVVLVAGEPGIGKTRLLAELAGQARADGWLVLEGRAYEREGMPPYLPFVEALRGYVRTCPDEDLLRQLGRGAADVVLLLPELGDRLPNLAVPPPAGAEPESGWARYRLFECVCEFLLAAARGGEQRGLLLVLDDLHWADTPSLLLVQHLARRVADAPLLLAGGYRLTELAGDHPLASVVAELHRERLATRLPLAPLSFAECAEQTAALTAQQAAPEVVAAIYRQTEGNPFFVAAPLPARHARKIDRSTSRNQPCRRIMAEVEPRR